MYSPALPRSWRRGRPLLLVAALGTLGACEGPPTLGLAAADAAVACRGPRCADDATPPPDAPVSAGAGPVLVFSDLHIASLQEAPHAFSLLGTALNPQLKTLLDNGTLRLGVMLADLDDPSGQADPEVTAGLVTLTDTDGDPANDFDADAPEQFTASLASVGADGKPATRFAEAAIAAGKLTASGLDSLTLPGGLPLTLQQLALSGKLAAGGSGAFVRTLDGGRLTGAIPASLLSVVPNLLSGQCGGATLLDVIATGCGFLAVQPDVDLDGDGLEKLQDLHGDADAGTGKDGHIDTCVDGDGTIIDGTGCINDPRIQDGYKLILVVTGVRAELVGN